MILFLNNVINKPFVVDFLVFFPSHMDIYVNLRSVVDNSVFFEVF